MPITATVDIERSLIRTTVTGNVTGEDILRYFEWCLESNSANLPELIDARNAGPTVLTPLQVRMTTQRVLALAGKQRFGPRAVVVNSDIVFGMTRMFAAMIAPCLSMQVFRDPAKGEAWLEEYALAEAADWLE